MILSRLQINNYCVSLSIGCTPEEHEKPQKVSFDVVIQFSKLPEACRSDNLSDSYCYAKITGLITKICAVKHYNLIEHLAYSIFEEVKKNLKPVIKYILIKSVTNYICGAL